MTDAHKWYLYNELNRIKHASNQIKYPFNGISGAKIEHTLNSITLKYENHQNGQPKYNKQKPGKKNKSHTGGNEYKGTGTITVYNT